MIYGARNQLIGKVTNIRRGDVMCQIKLDVSTPAEMSSVITMESLEQLGIREGDSVKLVVKAVNVLVVKE